MKSSLPSLKRHSQWVGHVAFTVQLGPAQEARDTLRNQTNVSHVAQNSTYDLAVWIMRAFLLGETHFLNEAQLPPTFSSSYLWDSDEGAGTTRYFFTKKYDHFHNVICRMRSGCQLYLYPSGRTLPVLTWLFHTNSMTSVEISQAGTGVTDVCIWLINNGEVNCGPGNRELQKDKGHKRLEESGKQVSTAVLGSKQLHFLLSVWNCIDNFKKIWMHLQPIACWRSSKKQGYCILSANFTDFIAHVPSNNSNTTEFFRAAVSRGCSLLVGECSKSH